ncbi:Imm26 family immunity protein [Bacillus cereus group sp. MYBK104-1]|nr:Imm26 family immunity protein [Bacillus cereus]
MCINYPFKPKSNCYLVPGQFWTIPLDNSKFACGRVIETDPNGTLFSPIMYTICKKNFFTTVLFRW